MQASAYNFIKKDSLAQVFSYEFCKFLKNNYGRLLLEVQTNFSRQNALLHLFIRDVLAGKLDGFQLRLYDLPLG